MADSATPRQMVKALLRGEDPPRPLLMPIIFSLGSRLENVTLRDFQSNPTKIANALRQIRTVLKVDGLACYFDPFLEAEALGCTLNWQPEGSPTVACPTFSGVHDLRRKLRSPDQVSGQGRIRVAADVIQRLKVMLKDEPALLVAVTGPLTLAAQLRGGGADAEDSLPLDLVEFSAEVTAAVCKTFVESGADVVLLVESSRTRVSTDAWESWRALLDPILNVIKFYEALPVLLFNDPTPWKAASSAVFSRASDCILCPELSNSRIGNRDAVRPKGIGLGIAMPTSLFRHEAGEFENAIAMIREAMRREGPAFLTSAGDIPATADIRHLATVLDTIRSSFPRGA